MESLVRDQIRFFKSGKTRVHDTRVQLLKQFESMLKENEALLYEAIYADFAKSEFETFTNELFLIYSEIKKAKYHLKYWSRRIHVKTNLINFPARSYRIPEPLGVCLVIGAWNYPYLLSLQPAVSALAAGNTVILKPSELPSETAAVMAKLVARYFDPEVFTVVQGGVAETTELLKQDFDKIFFTGSSRVGKIVYAAAAKNLIPVTLELGGKSPAIVTKTANIPMTVKRLAWAKFLNAGQTCIAPDYVMVHESVIKNFTNLIQARIIEQQYNIANGNYVRIINKAHFDRLIQLMQTGTVIFGGQTNAEALTIAPTLIGDVSFEDPLMQEELFGPLLPLIPYTDLSDALNKIKTLPKPLACYVFSKDRHEIRQVHSELSFGGGAVNDAVMHITNPELPFGGVGHSGIGAYHGKAGFDTFSHYKSILHKPFWFELPLKFSPYNNGKLSWIRRIMRL